MEKWIYTRKSKEWGYMRKNELEHKYSGVNWEETINLIPVYKKNGRL